MQTLEGKQLGRKETEMKPENQLSDNGYYLKPTPHTKSQAYEVESPLEEEEEEISPKKRLTPQKAASPIVIEWLQENYEASEGTSLPRSTLYAHYVEFCGNMNIEPVNAASFGKLIRSIFPTLKTRRLGTRGHSKYHYYGIRIKPNSGLKNANYSPDDVKSKPRSKSDEEKIPRMDPTSIVFDPHVTTGAISLQLPEFSFPEGFNFPSDINREHVLSFMNFYRQHCQELIDIVFKHHFSDVERVLNQFWQSLPSHYRIVVSNSDIIDQIIEKDQITYKAMATVLLPNVLQALPVSIPQAIRQFAKQLEPWVSSSLEHLPQELVFKKMHVTKKFSHSLHKQASLNHLTQAARAVLQNHNQVNQMLIDWSRLDFEFIKDQASWICQCGDDIINQAQVDFKRFLTERVYLEQWAQWLQEIVNKILGPKINDASHLVLQSQQLLLKWSFFSTLIIRDLTIRNASSFGSFHLLRTLFDEYIFYLIESKFALLLQQPSNYEETAGQIPYPFHNNSVMEKHQGEDEYISHQENYTPYQRGNHGWQNPTTSQSGMKRGYFQDQSRPNYNSSQPNFEFVQSNPYQTSEGSSNKKMRVETEVK